MDAAEAELSGPPEVRYRDPESAASVVVRPRELARVYQATVRREVDAWRTACRRHGIAYHHILTDMPFGMALRLLAGGSCIPWRPWGSEPRRSPPCSTCADHGRPRRPRSRPPGIRARRRGRTRQP